MQEAEDTGGDRMVPQRERGHDASFGFYTLKLMQQKAATLASIHASGAPPAYIKAEVEKAEAVYEHSLQALKKEHNKAKRATKPRTARAQLKESLNLKGKDYQPAYTVAAGMRAAAALLRKELGEANFYTPASGGGWLALQPCVCTHVLTRARAVLHRSTWADSISDLPWWEHWLLQDHSQGKDWPRRGHHLGGKGQCCRTQPGRQ